jgi:multidrug transporter EmrE-like cation transporter
MKWLVLILGIISNASASVLVKIAITAPRKFPVYSEPLEAFRNWPFWLGLILYGAAFLLYSAALARFPMNVAHPILTSGAIAVVALCSSLIFGEQIELVTVLGILLVISGVILITLHAH